MPFKNKKHLLHLVPHGINSDVFRPLSSTEKLVKFRLNNKRERKSEKCKLKNRS